jgi:oligoendopeptidase F
MNTAGKSASHALPQRTDIEGKYTWNLSELYATETDWEKDFQAAETLIGRAAGFAGCLSDGPDILFDCLETRSRLSIICANLYQYARLNQDLDNRVSKYQALSNRAAMLSSKASAAYSFVEPELLAVSDDRLLDLSRRFPRTDIYDFYFRDLIRSRAHIRSAEVEELLAQTGMMAQGPDTIFSMLDDADMKYPSIIDEHGAEMRLTKQRYARFMESSDRRLRRQANDAFISSYKDHVNTIGASLSAAVNKDVFFARARRYPGCLEAALDGHNIPVSVYHSLLETTEAGLAGLHEAMALRAKLLKLDSLYPYDVFCPLFPDQNYQVSYAEAVEVVLEAVRPLGEKYGETMRQGFRNRWVDVYETEGKGGGAYSWRNYTTHPFVLMNYNDTIDNMFTLAHEMGHALHSSLTNAAQPFPKADYSIFVAEVASTLNEGLLVHHLLKQAADPKQKLFLLARQIDGAFRTFFHQVMYARFELIIHELVEKGEALSPDRLNGLWADLTRQYYGPTVTVDEFGPYRWARIPHFYMNFYVYQYATSYAASQAILSKFLDGDKDIVERYLTLLSAGGSDYPIELLKRCGVDMAAPAPVEATLELFGRWVAEVKRLTE